MKLSGGWLMAVGAALLAVPVASGGERDDLLEEVRGLRRDLHVVAVVAQRIQLLVYRVHAQTEVVRRAKERAQQAVQSLDYTETSVARSAEAIKQLEETIRVESDRAKKQALELQLEYRKSARQAQADSLPTAQAETAESQREYSTEQAKLDSLLSRLDLLERQLEGLSPSLTR